MLLADFYNQQLKRQKATKILIKSGMPIRFSLPQGERSANAPMNHSQVTQLIEEISTPEGFKQLSVTGEGSVSYPPRQPEIKLHVKVIDESCWQITIIPVANPRAFNVPPVAVQAETEVAAPAVGRYGAAPNQAPSIPAAPDKINEISVPSMKEALSRPLGAEVPQQMPSYQNPSSSEPVPVSSESVPNAEAPVAQESVLKPKPASQTSLSSSNGEPKLNAYLRKMIELGASDLHMSSGMPPLIRMDGEIMPLDGDTSLSSDELSNILMEVIPEKNAIEFHETSDSDFAHSIEDLARFRANYFKDQNGVGAVFRQIPFEILTPEQLGLPEKVLDLCWLSKGLVLVTGPTGSGKSTTLASMVDYINRNRKDHIITIEDPVEFVHPNKQCLVNQREIGTHTKSFKSALRAALREDPDIVLVGEMRDLETIAIAIETAETGHLVFGTLHTTTAPSTVDRLIDQFPADQQSQIRTMLSESLKGVVAQVLCKAKPKGRAAAYEILLANPAISNNIREGKTHQLQSIMQTSKKDGMCTMNDSLLELVASGRVDAKEAYIKSVDKQGLKQMFQAKGIKLELDTKDVG